jgi:hypothetical protein
LLNSWEKQEIHTDRYMLYHHWSFLNFTMQKQWINKKVITFI